MRERRQLVAVRWGLIPSWADDAGMGARLFNARAQTAGERPAFRDALQRRRALVPCDGFYEWDGAGKAYVLRCRDRTTMALAALWDVWRGLETATILTVAANAMMRPIHNRMPAILAAEDWAAWLDPDRSGREVASLLRPAPDPLLDAVPVASRVNDVRNDDSSCLEPPDDPQLSFF